METPLFNSGTGLYEIEESSLSSLTVDNLTINNQIDMTNHKIVNLAMATDAGDATSKAYVDSVAGLSPWNVSGSDLFYSAGRVGIGSSSFTGGASVLQVTGASYLNGAVDVNGNIISNVHSPTSSGDATNKSYVDNKSYPLSTILANSNDANNYEISNIGALKMLSTPPAVTTGKIYISGGKVFYNGTEVGSVPTLGAVLGVSNSASTFNINMNSNEILSAFALQLSNNIPATVTNKLYNNGGTLYFNGTAVGVAQSLESTLAIGNSAGSFNINLNSNQLLNTSVVQGTTNQSLTVQATGTGTLFLANGASNTMILQSSGVTINQPVNLTSKNITNFNTISADTSTATGIIEGTDNLTGLIVRSGPNYTGSKMEIQAQMINFITVGNNVQFNGFSVNFPLVIRSWPFNPPCVTFGSSYSRNSMEFVLSESSWDVDNYMYLIRFSFVMPYNNSGSGTTNFLHYSVNNSGESSNYNGRNLMSYHNVNSVSGVYSNAQDATSRLIYCPNGGTITGCIGEIQIRKYRQLFGGSSNLNGGRLNVKAYHQTSYANSQGNYQAFEGGTYDAEYFITNWDSFVLSSFKLWANKNNLFDCNGLGAQTQFSSSIQKIPL